MLSLSDKIIYASYAVVVSLLMLLISRFGYKQYSGKVRGKRILRLGWPLVMYEFILVLVVVLFCAFREIDVRIGGTDAYGYKLQFLSSTGSISEQLIRFRGWEPIHALSLWAVRLFTENYRVYLVLYYILLSLMMIKISRMYEFRKGSYITLFALALFSLDSFNTQRNTFAAFMGFLIVGFLKNNQYKKALTIAIVAALIHYSAALYLISIIGFYYIRYIKGKYERKLAVYVVISMILSVAIARIIPQLVGGTRLAIYTQSVNVSVPMLLAFIAIAVFQIINHDELDKDADTAILSAMLLTFAPMFVFQLFYSIMYRMMLFSIPIMYVLIWKYKSYLRRKRDIFSIAYYTVFNAILLLRIVPFFAAEFSDIGSYINVIL